MARYGLLSRNRASDADIDTTQPIDDPRYDVVEEDRRFGRGGYAAPPSTGWIRVSAMATLGMIVGLVSLGAALTGLLAPVGFALGAVGAFLSMTGLVRASRAGVTGHSLALIGLLTSLAAVTLAALAMTGDYSWPNSQIDEVARLHDWLNEQFPQLERW
jgi:hypothetical protein